MLLRALVLPLALLASCEVKSDELVTELAVRQRTTGLSLARVWGQEIAVITFDGASFRKAFAPGGAYWYEACFTRDARHVIGSTRKGVVVADVAGKVVEQFSGLLGGVHIACSPSGKAFALEATNESGEQGLFLVVADKGVRLISSTGKYPAWSPDEKAIAYEDGGKIVRYDIGEQRDIALMAGSLPSWPRQDLLVSYQDGRVQAIDPTGAEPAKARELFRDPNLLSPLRWSPDNTYAMYARTGKGSLSCLEAKEVIVWRVRDGAKTAVESVCKSLPYSYDWLPDLKALAPLPTLK